MAGQASRHLPDGLLNDALGAEEWMLVRLRDQLYGGLWAEMRTDLECRRKGEPYIFKLAHRIEEDLERITRLEAFEQDRGINLRNYLPVESA
jgi:hypothetical protein